MDIMIICSVNIGHKKSLAWKGKTFETAICKQPESKPCRVTFMGILGDTQINRKYHGGETKAVYSYDISYYENWKNILPRSDWQHGMFGENLTTKDFRDDGVFVGNLYKLGTSLVQAMEPRFPCSTLNARFQHSAMVKLFARQPGHGTYFKVLEEGMVQAGDEIVLLERSPYDITISDLVFAYHNPGKDMDKLQSILDIPYLPKGLRKTLERGYNGE